MGKLFLYGSLGLKIYFYGVLIGLIQNFFCAERQMER